MGASIIKYSSAVFAVAAAGAALIAPTAGADPTGSALTDCVVVAKITTGVDGSAAPGAHVQSLTGFMSLQRQIQELDQPEGTPRPQVVEAMKKQIALQRQERTLLLAGAGQVKDPDLAGVIRDNGNAIGAYVDATEKLLPYSQDNPPPDDVKDAYDQARERKHETGEAMTQKVQDYCDLGPDSN